MERERANGLIVVLSLALVVALLFGGLWISSGSVSSPDDADQSEPTAGAVSAALEAIGGVEALALATAEGSFDLVRFDPNDSSAVLAVHRRSYGPAENQTTNELWAIDEDLDNGEVRQRLWAPDEPHDFAHFNRDGTVTRWIHAGGPDFAPRTAQVFDRGMDLLFETGPLYASRFTVDNRRVFALLGDGVYGSDAPHVSLIADDGSRQVPLADGAEIAWIDSPAVGLLLAYPTTEDGLTRVWRTDTLDEVSAHALSGRHYQRAAISADGSTAVGASTDGPLEVIDLRTGRVSHSFGFFDVRDVDQPLTLSADGSVVVTVERDGLVGVWWVADGTRLLAIAGEAAQPRWLSETYAPRSTSAVSWDATRLAVRSPARPGVPNSWTITDIDVESWLRRAESGR